MIGRLSARTFTSATFTFLLAIMLQGCSDDEGRPGSAFDARNALPFPGCEAEFFGSCRYWEGECQRQVFSTVRCLRGSEDATLPLVRERTPAQVVAELEVTLQTSAEDAEIIAAYDHAAVLLGLAEDGELGAEGELEVFIETVPAFYSPESGAVTIVVGEDGSHSEDDAWNTITLAHEFVHALQDQQHDLRSIQTEYENTYDSYLAARSAVEGEATMLESFYEVAMRGYRQESIDFRSTFIDWGEAAEDYMAGMSPLLGAPRVFPYSYGARFVYNVYDFGGMSSVRNMRNYIPRATATVLKSRDSAILSAPAEGFGTAIAPPQGYRFVTQDVLGAWILSRLGHVQGLSELIEPLVDSWQRDHLAVYVDSAGLVTTIWRIELASGSSATDLAGALDTATWYPANTGHSVATEEGLVTLVVTDDPTSLEAWNASRDSGATVTLESSSENGEASAGRRRLRLSELIRKRQEIYHYSGVARNAAPSQLRH